MPPRGCGPLLDKVVDVPFVVQCVDKVVDVPVVQVLVVPQPVIEQVQGMVQTLQISCSSWTRLMTPVVVRRQVLGVAENCGSSAVAVLGQVVTCPLLRRQVHGGAVFEQGEYARCCDDRSIGCRMCSSCGYGRRIHHAATSCLMNSVVLRFSSSPEFADIGSVGYGGDEGALTVFSSCFALLQVVLELIANYRSPR